MKAFGLIFLLALIVSYSHAQTLTPDTVNTNPVTELQTVQTPSNTFIIALMETPSGNYNSATTIYRSTDNGVAWDSVFSYGSGAGFNATPDPVLTVDDDGNVYLCVMRHLPVGGGFTAHLWVYKSVDDGLTWNLASMPYASSNFADYPSITSLVDERVYLSYTLYGSNNPSYITFMRSFDGGVTWTDTSEFVTLPAAATFWAVGSDLGWSAGNKLCLSYGDYNHNEIYFTSSNDSGATWTPVQNITIAANSLFNITKIVSSKDYSHLGIIAHQPHYLTNVYYLTSLDSGNTWQYQTISNNSAYCEGLIDYAGNIHLVYNENSGGAPRLCYRYSADEGQTFAAAATLLSWSSVSLTSGEYQSLLLGNDGLLHVIYVDWNDGGAAKHLVFAPSITDIYQVDPSTHAPRIFPNPVHNVLSFLSDATNTGGKFDLLDLVGNVVRSGSVNIPITSADISSLESGTYLLRISNGSIIYVQKVVKN